MKRPYNRKPQHAPAHQPVHEPVHEPAHAESRIPRAPTGLTRKEFDSSSSFDIDSDTIASFNEAGWDLNFKAETVFGEEQTQRMKKNHANGWEEVDASMAPGIMPNGYRGSVRIDGQVLMMRPKYLSENAERQSKHEATRQVSSQVEKSRVGDEGEGPRTRATLTRDWSGE